jgi:hypothetical protein
MKDRFAKAKQNLRKAEEALLQASIAEFPVGCRVTWRHGKYNRYAIVTWHSDIYLRVGLKNLYGKELRPMSTLDLTVAERKEKVK